MIPGVDVQLPAVVSDTFEQTVVVARVHEQSGVNVETFCSDILSDDTVCVF